MGIPGYSFHLPQADPTTPLPLPKVNQASSLNLNYATKDQFVEEDELTEKAPFLKPNVFLPPQGNIIAAEFVKKIHSLLKTNPEDIAKEMDQYLNENETSFATLSSQLRTFKAKLEAYLFEWIEIENNYSHHLQKMNGQISLLKKLKSPIQEDSDFLHKLFESFKTEVNETNQRIYELNLKGNSLCLRKIPEILFLEKPSLKRLKSIPKRKQPNIQETLKKYYEPLHNATIGYMTDVQNLLNISKEITTFNRIPSPLKDFSFLYQESPELYFELISHNFLEDLTLTRAISSTTLEKILASTAIRSAMLEAKTPLTKLEIDELQLLIVNLMSKAALQAASSSIHLLGNEWGKLGISEEHITLILAIGMNQRIVSFINRGITRENVITLIKNNSRIKHLINENIDLLIRKLTSIVNLALLQQGLVQAGISIRFLSLIQDILASSMKSLNISKAKFEQTFNDVIYDRSYKATLQCQMIESLKEKQSSLHKPDEMVKKAFEKTLLNGPYSNLEFFGEQLSLELQSVGNISSSNANELSMDAINLLMDLAPHALLNDKKIFLGITLPLIHFADLLSDKTIGEILSEYNKEKFQPIYIEAVNRLLNHCSYEALFSSLLLNPLLESISEDSPPKTVKETFIHLYRSFIAQNVSVEDALGIAESIVKFLLNSKCAHLAFKNSPAKIRTVLNHFISGFERNGLTSIEAIQLSKSMLPSLISNKLFSLDLEEYNPLFDCIFSTLLLRSSFIDISFGTKIIGKKVLSHSVSLLNENSLNIAIRNELKSDALDDLNINQIIESNLTKALFDPATSILLLEKELQLYNLPKELALIIAPYLSFFSLSKNQKILIGLDQDKLRKYVSKELHKIGFEKKSSSFISKVIIENSLVFRENRDASYYYNSLILHLNTVLGIEAEGLIDKNFFQDCLILSEDLKKTKNDPFSKKLKEALTIEKKFSTSLLLSILNIEETHLSSINKALEGCFSSLHATKSSLNFKYEFIDRLSDIVVDKQLFEQLKEKIEGFTLPKFILRELVISQLLLIVSKNRKLSLEEKNELRMVGDVFFRKSIYIENNLGFSQLLKDFLKEVSFLNKKEIEEICEMFSFDVINEEKKFNLQSEVRLHIQEICKNIISQEKSEKISNEFNTVISSVQALIEEQLNVLVGEAFSQNYKKLIIQGVLDTMQSSTQVNFDLFIFTEILNSNGKKFLKLIQETLLNNIGVNDLSNSETIDLLI